jgi:hypothetical protein
MDFHHTDQTNDEQGRDSWNLIIIFL